MERKKERKESLAAVLAAAAKSQLASTPPQPILLPGVCVCVCESFTGFHLRESKHADLGEKKSSQTQNLGMTGGRI